MGYKEYFVAQSLVNKNYYNSKDFYIFSSPDDIGAEEFETEELLMESIERNNYKDVINSDKITVRRFKKLI